MQLRRALSAALATVAVVAAPGVPAAADPLPHGGAPRAVDLRPAPGAVVAAGSVELGALVTATAPVRAPLLRIDGRDVPTAASRGTHAALSAQANLPPGDHVAQVVVAGRVLRAWRFTVSGLDVTRLAGADRVETAVAISRDLYRLDGSARSAALARQVGGPLLLTGSGRLDDAVVRELRRALEPGATVFLLGGPGALSGAVEAEVAALGFVPRRLAGRGRAETAARVARLVRAAPGGTVVVASGDRFPDALAISSPAASRGWPVLLTGGQELDAAVRAYLEQAPPAEVVVVGGAAAVSDGVRRELEALAPRVERVSGASRYETAQAVAERFFDRPAVVALVAAERFPDALAGGPHAAATGAPLLLVSERLPPPQQAQVRASPPARAVVYGGEAAVGDAAVGDLRCTVVDHDGPRVRGVSPAPGATLAALDELAVRFDREVLPAHSSLYLTVGGHEAAGTLRADDGGATLRLAVEELPADLVPGRRYDVRLVGAATDGATWVHLDETLTYAVPAGSGGGSPRRSIGGESTRLEPRR